MPPIEDLEISKPIQYEGKVVSLKVNKDKSITFSDEDKKIEKEQLERFISKLSEVNNKSVKLPLDWEETWVKALIHVFAVLSTFTIMNYLIYIFQGIKLNNLEFVFDLTWLILTIIPIAIVIGHVFSESSIQRAKLKFLESNLPFNIKLNYFIVAFYNSMNDLQFFSKKEQAIRNAHVVTKDIFEEDGLKMLEKDLKSWLKISGIGIKNKA